jgi:hypothetical protein
MPRMLLALCLLALLPAPAWAQLADDGYVTQYFGTTAALAVDKPLPPLESFWMQLPQALTQDSSLLVHTVNALRQAKGVQPLLGGDEHVMTTGQDGKNAADGKYYYTLDFDGLRPSEVQAVIDALGGVDKLFPGAKLSFWPINRQSFSASAEPGQALALIIGGEELRIDPATPVTTVRQQVAGVLKRLYGGSVEFNLYMNQDALQDGTSGCSVGADVQIPTSLVPALEYELQGE